MNHVLVIFDLEEDYTSSLQEYIKRTLKTKINVHGFTNQQKFEEYSKDNVIEVLLISEKLNISTMNQSNIRNICVLWEGEKEEISSYPNIYKYQSAKGILEILMEKYPKLHTTRQETNSKSKTKVISFFSLDNKKMQSQYAFEYAKLYSKSYKVLYINLHSWSLLPTLYHIEDKKVLSELIYFLKTKSPNLIHKFRNAIEKLENLDYIYGVASGLDLMDLTKETVTLWIDEMSMWKEYQIIIFDVGNLYPYGLELLKRSTKIIYTYASLEDKREYDNLSRDLDYIGYHEITEKTELYLLKQEPLSS